MGEVGGPRHYQGSGRTLPGTYKWTCPGCQTEHVTPLEQGCPVCAARQAARPTPAPAAPATIDQIADAVLARPSSPLRLAMLRAEALTPAARETLVRALAYYLAQAQPSPTDLATPILIGWAQQMTWDPPAGGE